MEVFVRNPLPTFALIVGGIAVAAAAGMVRNGHYPVALTCGVLGVFILIGAGWMMLRTPDWGTTEDWGPVASNARQRLNFFLVAIGTTVLGLAAMWFGFGPGGLVSGLLLVGAGWLIFLCGVVCLVGWLQGRLFS